MNFAVGRVEYGQARRLYVQEIEGAVEDALNHFVEIRAGVDVVGDVEQGFGNSRLFFLFAVDVCVAITDGDLLRQIAYEIDLVVVPTVRLAAMMQADESEQLQIEGDGDDQYGFAAEAFDEFLQSGLQLLRMAVGDSQRMIEIYALLQTFQIDARFVAEQRRQFVARRFGAIFVGDAEAALRRQRHHVAAVNAHHLADFGNRRLQKMVEVDDREGLRADAAQNRLARLIHMQLAL